MGNGELVLVVVSPGWTELAGSRWQRDSHLEFLQCVWQRGMSHGGELSLQAVNGQEPFSRLSSYRVLGS